MKLVLWRQNIADPGTLAQLATLAGRVEAAWDGKDGRLVASDITLEAVSGRGPGSGLAVTVDGEAAFGMAPGSAFARERPEVLVKFDSAPVNRRLNVSGIVRGSLEDLRLKFLGYWNYDSWIEHGEVRIFRMEDGVQTRPSAIVALNAKKEGEFAIDGELAKAFEGNELKYVLRVYDAQGRFDETAPKSLKLVPPRRFAEHDGDTNGRRDVHAGTDERALLAGHGRSILSVRNIKLGSGTITVFARHLPKDARLNALGRSIPADASGKAVIEKLVNDGQHDVDVLITVAETARYRVIKRGLIKANDYFLVALGDFTAGRQVIRAVGQPSQTEKIFDARGALYFKGKVRGDVLITAMADVQDGDLKDIFGPLNGRDPRRFLRRLDPDKHYPVYGDDSTIIEDAPTSGRFYVKIEHDNSYVMWGNFRSDFKDTEYGRSSRALNGAKTSIQTGGMTIWGEPVTKVKAFAANPESQSARDELRGTGGSIYYLRRSDLVLGSEEVRVEVRDRQSNITLSSRLLVRGEDYDVDYLQGRIVLNKPLSSTADEGGVFTTGGLYGHPIVLVVQYEYLADPADKKDLIYGARVAHWMNDHIMVGGTMLRENGGRNSQTPFELYGIDLTMRYRPGTFIKAEFAQSFGTAQSAYYSSDGGYTYETRQLLGNGRTARRSPSMPRSISPTCRLQWTGNSLPTTATVSVASPRSDTRLSIRRCSTACVVT
ncbi:MAG: hypothetical protein R3D67_07715 [Hyphomicrobiaceae bacterium]